MEFTEGFLQDTDLVSTEEVIEESGFLEDVETNGKAEGRVDYSPEIHFSSSEDMDEVDDESVELIITSPPYNVGWEYGEDVDDEMEYSTEYLPMLARVFTECYRVLAPGGRLVVNVPSLVREGTEGGIPIASDLMVMMSPDNSGLLLRMEGDQEDIGTLRTKCDWKIRETIAWDKEYTTDGFAPNGSFPRPWGVLLNNMHEYVIVFQKPGERDVSEIPEDVIEDSKIEKWEKTMCDDVWHINPETWELQYAEDEKVPPYPEELVKRCIALWTYKNDTVLDPFGGRGTTCKVAKEMERESIMYELREELEKDIENYVGVNQSQLDNW